MPVHRSSIKPISTELSALLKYLVEFSGVAIIYLALAKLSLALASVHPSATPIWPPTGYALAAVLLLGYRISPAIFLGALVANVTTAGSVGTSLAIATGNTLGCAWIAKSTYIKPPHSVILRCTGTSS